MPIARRFLPFKIMILGVLKICPSLFIWGNHDHGNMGGTKRVAVPHLTRSSAQYRLSSPSAFWGHLFYSLAPRPFGDLTVSLLQPSINSFHVSSIRRGQAGTLALPSDRLQPRPLVKQRARSLVGTAPPSLATPLSSPTTSPCRPLAHPPG